MDDSQGSEQDLGAIESDAESAPLIRRWLSLAKLITHKEDTSDN